MIEKENTAYAYIGLEEESPLQGSRVGEVINALDVRWIVANFTLQSITVAKWPGRLYEVEVLDFVTNEQARKLGKSGLTKRATYKRALKVEVLKELPLHLLFGDLGENVKEVIDSIPFLEEAHVAVLNNISLEKAEKLYSKIWNKWLKKHDPDSYHIGNTHYNSMAIYTSAGSSPIHKAFFIISSQINKKAKDLLGEDAYYKDEENEMCLDPAWSNAKLAFFYGAMAVGTDGYLTEKEKEILKEPWVKYRTMIPPKTN